VLATQNPVDLDYKGLANCGTWFLGRLQTERDKLRVLDGLEGASAASGASFNRADMDQLLSGLGNRVFLMNNVHEDHPVVFQTRWALSFLRGPLTRDQIGKLMEERKATTSATGSRAEREETIRSGAAKAERPILPPEITERFVTRRANLPAGSTLAYHPAVLGQAKLHFAQASTGVDHWQDVSLLLPIDDAVPAETWTGAETCEEPVETESQPEASAKFANLPGELSRPKRYGELATALKDHLYRNQKLSLWKCASLKQTSKPGESEAEFRVRLSQQAREERDAAVESLRQKYAPKIASLQERVRRAQIKVDKEKSQATEKTLSAALSMGASLIGAMFSRKMMSSANITRAASSMKQAGRIARERQDVSDANEGVGVLQQRLEELESELKVETDQAQADLSPDKLPLTEQVVQPKKSEINVSAVTLVWLPFVVSSDGKSQPAY
jgi:hypothetical protein